jgi:hypothetical protein
VNPANANNEAARAALEGTLQRWHLEGLIHSNWQLEWDRAGRTWMVAFQMLGCATRHTYTAAEFGLYLLGFTERSIAIRHRRPLHDQAPTPSHRESNRV